MSEITRSPQAERDLDSIGDYIADRSDSLETAYRVLDAIEETIQFVAKHPGTGQLRPDLHAEVRQFPVKAYNYVVYYRPTEDSIELVRVLHGSRDVPNVFHLPE